MIVKLSAKILSIPNICCSCCIPNPEHQFVASASRSTGKRVVHTTSRAWEFPICASCTAWIKLLKRANTFLTFSYVMFIVDFLTLVNGANGGIIILFSLIFAGLVYGWHVNAKEAKMTKPNGAHANPVHYAGWYGTVHTFQVSNPQFADQFAHSNRNKLIA